MVGTHRQLPLMRTGESISKGLCWRETHYWDGDVGEGFAEGHIHKQSLTGKEGGQERWKWGLSQKEQNEQKQ